MNLLWSQVILVSAMMAYGIYVFRFRTVLTDRIVPCRWPAPESSW
jgi:hypothetical protein